MKPEVVLSKRSIKLTNLLLDGRREKKTQSTKIRSESGDITTDSTET